MNRLHIGMLICLGLISCTKTDKEKSEMSDSTHSEKTEITTIQLHTLADQILPEEEIILPTMEISRESLLAGFPESPDYFIKNDINVTIKRYDERSSQTPIYFGLEPVFVTGENFTIIYSTDNGYKIKCIILAGKTIFSYWNQFFDAKWSDVIRSWGPPPISGTSWFNSTDYYGVVFSFDKMTDKIKEIRINEAP